ncbi:MAG TPA: flagellar biosynthesis anti-sigma factor FlgM [Chondromyces sp.]|nr:flagellar biosynthesis anti-sigma factor FlgM [Chondromyces sp.]
MKINNHGVSGINPYQKQLNKVNEAKKASASMPTDKLEISAAAKEMQSSSVMKERQAKIESLKQQVESGEYKPNAESIAKGIIKFYRG